MTLIGFGLCDTHLSRLVGYFDILPVTDKEGGVDLSSSWELRGDEAIIQ